MAALRSRSALVCLSLLILASTALAVNHAPTLMPIGFQEVYVGETLAFPLTAKDIDGNQVLFSGSNLPSGASLNPNTGYFSWQPTIDQVGKYPVTFTTADNGTPPLASSEKVLITVIFRTVSQQKAWGFGIKPEETVIATSNPADLYPKISQIEVGGQPAASLHNLDVSEHPKIKIILASPYNIDMGTVSALIDNAAVGSLSFSDLQSFGAQGNILSLAVEVAPNYLAPGAHVLTLRAGNSLGVTAQDISLNVGGLRISDTPLTFPSPFAPGSGQLVMQYTLSEDADIQIMIISSSGQIVKKINVYKGNEGGRAGLNKVPWDGRTDYNMFAGNGIYLVAIMDQQNNTILGRAKLTIYR